MRPEEWLHLANALTPGSKTFITLYQHFGSAQSILSATREELLAVTPNAELEIDRLFCHNEEELHRMRIFCANHGYTLLSYEDAWYPDTLRARLPNPPPLLYMAGSWEGMLHSLKIAIVGTRKMSDRGSIIAGGIARDLSARGCVIVSGMALGIDGIAQSNAVSVSGETIAVWGSGIDVVYPKEHTFLAKRIMERGAVITEFPLGTPPYGRNFPLRNRIISALSHAVVVVEADAKSGALITAEYAKKQGIPVYVVPGNAEESSNDGVSLLLKQGAKAITCADDILEDLGVTGDLAMVAARRYDPPPADVKAIADFFSVHQLSPDPTLSKKEKHKRIPSASFIPHRKDKGADTHYTRESESDAYFSEELLEKKKENTERRNSHFLKRVPKAVLDIYESIPEEDAISLTVLASQFRKCDLHLALAMLEANDMIITLPGERVKRANK